MSRWGATARAGLAVVAAVSAWFVWRSMRASEPGTSYLAVTTAWLVLLAALTVAFGRPRRIPSISILIGHIRSHRREFAGVATLVLVALLLRVWRLDAYPTVFNSDEGNFGVSARAVVRGQLRNPFATGWFSHPTFYFFIQAGAFRMFGDGVVAARVPSALIGTLTVLVTYGYTRRQFGRTTAAIAAAFVAVFHLHLFVSRIALNNAADAFFMVMSLWLLDRMTRRRRPIDAVFAGLAIGLAQYFFFGARLLPVLAVVVVAHALFVGDGDRRVRQRLRSLVPLAGTMLLTASGAALPLLAYATKHYDNVMARTRQVSVFSSGWLDGEHARTGRSAVAILVGKLVDAAFVPFTSHVAGFYRTPPPFVGWPMVVPVAIGLTMATIGIRQRRYAGLAIGYWMSVIALALTEGDTPLSSRFVGIVPLLCIFAALGLVTAARTVKPFLGMRTTVALATMAVGVIAGWNLHRYFRDDDQQAVYSDINTEVADTLARSLADRAPGETVFFYGPPRMWYDGFANLEFRAPDVIAVSVVGPLEPDAPRPSLSGPTSFVFLPERLDGLAVVQRWFPSGVRTDALDPGSATLLYVEWRVSRPSEDDEMMRVQGVRAFRAIIHHVEREHAQDRCFTATDLGGPGTLRAT